MKSIILQNEAPALREHAVVVPVREIESKKIQSIITKMKRALHAEDDGVALAAPQIGEGLRIFVVASRTLALLDNKKPDEADEKRYPDLVYINPELTKLSRKKKKVEEGCLSVRWLYGQVKRSEKVVLKAFDENGKKVERGASGLMAQIFQHEVDHLNGILFIDKATDIQDIPPSTNNEK